LHNEGEAGLASHTNVMQFLLIHMGHVCHAGKLVKSRLTAHAAAAGAQSAGKADRFAA
jgi:hypothetical protein